jgi:hypothetical protein
VSKVQRIYPNHLSYRAQQIETEHAAAPATKPATEPPIGGAATALPATPSDAAPGDAAATARQDPAPTSDRKAPLTVHEHLKGRILPSLRGPLRVLLLTKKSRYELEKQILGLSDDALHAELARLGFVTDRLFQSYVRHVQGLAHLTTALQNAGFSVTRKEADSATWNDIHGVDLVISAGGDGTLLRAASIITPHPPMQRPKRAAAAAALQAATAGHVIEYQSPLDNLQLPPGIDVAEDGAQTSAASHISAKELPKENAEVSASPSTLMAAAPQQQPPQPQEQQQEQPRSIDPATLPAMIGVNTGMFLPLRCLADSACAHSVTVFFRSVAV